MSQTGLDELVKVYEAALEALRSGQPAALATVIESKGSTPRAAGAKMLVYADGQIVGTIGGGEMEARVVQAAREALQAGQSRTVSYDLVDEARGDPGICGGGMSVFIEVAAPRTLVILGGGHIGHALAELAHYVGYRVAVLDERPELVTEERFPHAVQRLSGDVIALLADFPLNYSSFVVLVTPHHSLDEKLLAALTDRPLAYVGLIGSRRRTAATFERARAAGVSEDLIARVHTPIGLDIGAETPREIALAILAEVLAVERGKDRKKDRKEAS